MNATDDGDEPMGENPASTGFQILGTNHLGESPVRKIIATAEGVLAQAQLAERQGQALKEIRGFLSTVDAMPFVRDSFNNAVISGKKNAMAVIAAILEGNGLC